MKFHFTVQPYQTDAVEAVVGVFEGQPYAAHTTYLRDVGMGVAQGNLLPVQESYMNAPLLTAEADDGFCNEELALTKAQLLANIRSVQSARNLHRSDTLSAPFGACALDVEMETGKTYVYSKTMFELNRRYGWSKFIAVVPSIAIREGVKKSFEMTVEHFMEHYGRKARCVRLAPSDRCDCSSTGAFGAELRECAVSVRTGVPYEARSAHQR